MSAKASFSLGKALSEGLSSLPQAWGGAWLSLILLWVVTVGGHLALMHAYGTSHAAILAAGAMLVAYVLTLMAEGALYRTALFGSKAKSEGLGLGGLQLGAPELRLFGASILIALFMVVIVIAALIVLAVAFNMSGLQTGYTNSLAALHAAFMRHHTGADWTFIVLVPLLLLFFVFLRLKFTLYAAATVAEKRMVTLNALGLSSGNVGKLFLGLVAIAVPFFIVWGVILHLSLHGRLHAHTMPQAGSTYHLHLLLHGIMMAMAFGLWLPVQTGFLSSAYRQIIALRAK